MIIVPTQPIGLKNNKPGILRRTDYDALVRMKVLEEYKNDQYKNVSLEVYNYITFLYLAALYEGKDKFAQELWDKARIK